ncbi:LysM peptidoglycan-binding domain-containing protein [Bacillus altitudinis]|uniref:LysM peptidoglycan-binding domain-containing protein n=1 Tax=Bacillus altitudinis TaxID=293387 RepID=UPI002DB9E4A7|nr:LysM peptidoglycan-binding domain-containing protein [Bacillus altitudinis]MEC2040464.1 LysM peptidoglycan-binding domain-containing protein [Bacillus altitudinis]
MSQNNRLQFSVEESIYFKNGQEVSELLSISLDPDILVQEVNDYVSIRGSLELTGEYNINQEELMGESSSYASYRQADEVKVREDGTAELLHQFPVDITIPKNKISHLNDVFVFIDAFDYQLTESRLLTIQADLAIEGLLDEGTPEPLVEEPYEFVHRAEEEYGDVTYEYQAQPEYEEQEMLPREEHEENAEQQAALQHEARTEQEEGEIDIETVMVEEAEEEEEYEEEEAVALGYRSFPEAQVQEPPFFDPPKLLEEEERDDTFFEVEVRKDPEAESKEEEPPAYPAFESPTYQMEQTQEERDDSYQFERLYEREAPKVYESAQEAEEFEHDQREASGSENSLYLTKLFAKQEEEDFSRMKICIVQQEDTVDRICERYQLNVQQLLRTNSLSVDAELEEGQILYIPEYQKSNA